MKWIDDKTEAGNILLQTKENGNLYIIYENNNKYFACKNKLKNKLKSSINLKTIVDFIDELIEEERK